MKNKLTLFVVLILSGTLAFANPFAGGTNTERDDVTGFERTTDPIDDFPWTEGFDGVWVGDPEAPEGWTVVNGISGSYWEQHSTSFAGGYSARSYQGAASGNQADEWLITPALDLTGDYGFVLSFYGFSSQAPDGTRENMRIMILDDIYDNVADLHANATEVIVVPFTSSWEEHLVSLVGYSGVKYLAFNYYITDEMNASFNWIYVDEVIISEILDYDFVVNNLSGDLAVQAGTSAMYDIAIDNRGLEDDTYDITIAGGIWTYTAPATFSVDGGEIDTFEVEVSVPADAEMGEVDTVTLTVTSQGDSDISHELALTTTAIATISAPYFQDFDDVTAPALPLGWSKIVDHPTSTVAVVETYTLGTPLSPPNHVRLHSNQEEADIMLITPPIVGLSDNSLGFWARCNLSSNIPDLIIGTMSDPLDAETFIPFHTFEADEDLTNVYQFFIVDFTDYTGTDEYVAFKHGGTPNFFRSIYIDDVTLGVPYLLTVTINPEDAGTVTGDGLWFEDGEAPLSATANEGFIFHNWTDADDNVLTDDDGEPYGDSFTFTMPAEDVTLNANFLPTYEVTFTVEDTDENALQGVAISYEGDFQSGTLTTGADGTATVQLIDGLYDYTAFLIGYDEVTGDFTVAADDVSVAITLPDADPTLLVDPDPFDFGEMALDWTSDPQVFTLTNIGGDGLVINGVTLIDPDGQFTLTDDNDYTDGISLDTGEDISVSVVFTPTMEGLQSATLEIAYNDGSAQSHDVDVTGTGIDITIVDFPWFENFTGYPTGNVPPFWIRTHNNWAVWNTSNAGGEAPELRFHWSPSTTGVLRAIPPPFDATDLTGLELTFKYMVNDYQGGYDLKVQVSLDAGDTWEDVWLLSINGDKNPEGLSREESTKGDVPATEATVDLSDYDGEVFHIAFVYDGNSFNINQWYIDDILMDADLPELYEVTFHVVEDTADEDPIEGATITIGDHDPIHTDASGMAMIHLEDGGYTAHVSKDGFSTEQVAFTVDGEDKTVHVAMTESDIPDDVIDDFPWFEDFEALWVDNPGYEESPEGWFVVNGASGSYWQSTTVQSNTGERSARSYQGAASSNLADEWLISPAFNLDNPDATQMIFHGYSNQAPDGTRENMRIMLLDQPYDNVADLHANAIEIVVIPFTQTWEEYLVNLEAYSGVKHVAFNYYITDEMNATFNWIYIDDIIVGSFDIFTLTMLDPVGGGTVSPEVGDHDFTENTVVPLLATADMGYTFSHWTGDVEDPNSAATTILMDGDKTVQAHFVDFDGFDLPWTETFTGIPNGELPANWVRTHPNWGVWNTSNAGGEAPEMRFNFSPSSVDVFRLTSPKINTSGYDALLLSMKHYVNNFSAPGIYTLRIIAIADDDEYIIQEWVDPDNIGPEELEFILTAGQHGVGTDDFYIAWELDGDSYDINQWYIDDIFLGEAPDLYEVTFFVGEDNVDETPIEGASINIDGDIYHTDENGLAVFMLVNDQTYTANVTASGYVPEEVTFTVDGADVSVDVLLMDLIQDPFNLEVVTEGLEAGQALLTWNTVEEAPLFEDFEEGVMPDGWDQVITNTGTGGPIPATWNVNDYVSSDFSPFGTYHAGLWWDYGHQDEWLISPEIVIGSNYELEFWSAVFLGSVNADHYYVKISTDGGDNWTELWDASAQTGGWNYYNTPFVLDLSAYSGQNVHIAFNAVDGPTNDGLWYIWFIDNVSVGPEGVRHSIAMSSFQQVSKSGNNTSFGDGPHMISRDGSSFTIPGERSERAFLGFNVYLNDALVAEEIMDTEYLFTNLPDGEHTAGVQSVYTTGSSDIVTIDFEITDAAETFEVTFEVDITQAVLEGQLIGFDPDMDHIFITGSMLGWAEPGSAETVMTQISSDPWIYAMTFDLAAGTYQYKYFSDFLGDGWDGGEYHGGDDREVLVDADMTVEDVFTIGDAPEFTVTFEVFDTEGAAVDNAVITFGGVENPAGDYVFEGVTPGTYDYDVVADGYKPVSGQATIVDADLTIPVELEPEVGTVDIEATLSIFPNPAREMLYIESDSDITGVRVVDILGQVVYSSSVDSMSHELSVSGFDPGVYFIQVTTTRGVITQRVQVSR